MATTSQSTWLITGASSGFGKSLAMEAARASHKVIGTTRNIQTARETFPQFQEAGGIWLQLDPGDEKASEEIARYAEEHGIDVLVNNAGYAFIGGVEDTR